MRRLLTGVTIALFVSASAFAAEGSAPSPAIKFSGSRIQVTGVTPGGTVLIYGTAMLYENYGEVLHRYRQVVVDDAREGAVSWDIGRGIPPRGVWIAIDTSNGEIAVGAPGQAVAAARPQAQSLRARSGTITDTFSFTYPFADVIYVHPGHGAWSFHGIDGAPFDRDPRAGVTAVGLEDAISLLPNGEAKPAEFAAGGTLVAIDLSNFHVFAMRIGAADLGGLR
jgi:hypothetical protein